ncbi:sensor histidine kinase [Magnetospirillum gryphiswaldense]|uniref:sensor histidine kinase n=1 Tax=Magnetospirillum gryphiswaldense TaxID=55518 RepID=UPI001F202685|nr:ATP-binding protein [Magnetospirillum gryphiswaldense]
MFFAMQDGKARHSGDGIGQRVSVRMLIITLIASLLGVVAMEVGIDFLTHMRQYHQAQAMRRDERIIGHLMLGAQHLAFERGRTSVVLRAVGPVEAANRKFLDERRTLADAEFRAAIHMLDDANVPLARKLSRQTQSLAELRRRADALMALPQDQRDKLFADYWFDAVSAMLGSIPESVYMLGAAQTMPPLARVSLQAFDLRNALGVESSRIASALAVGRVPDQVQMHDLARLRGQGDAALANLRREVILLDAAALNEALARVDSELLRGFRPVQDAVLHAFANGRLPQETVPHYTSASVPALDAVAAIMSVAAQEGVFRAEKGEKQARMEMTAYAALLLVSLVLALAAMAVVGRVMGSARALRLHLGDLADGKLDPPPATPLTGRELVDLSRTAHALRLSLLERFRLESELAEVSRQNRLILEHAADGILALDEQGRTIFANPAVQRLSGWTLADLEGRAHHDLVHHSHADGSPYAVIDCPVHQTLHDGISRRVDEDVFWCKDGTCLPVELSVSPWMDGDRRGVVVAFRDITQRKMVQERNRQLLDELQRSNTELESFAYAISHDLQAPLRTISGFVALARRAVQGKVDDNVDEFMQFAEQGARRMAAMVAALLDYARFGIHGDPPRPVAVGEVIGNVLVDLAALIADTGGTVVVDDDLPRVMADPAQLASVLQNLIGNGLKYAGTSARPAEVRVAGGLRGERAVITVCDNGPGIAADQREALFGLFTRGGTHDGIDGLGMGLAICKRIVTRLGGTIHIEDASGGGACFVITLPVA